MTDLLLIAVAAATINNFVLERLLGLCPVVGAGSRLEGVKDVSLTTTGVLTITAALSYLLEQWVLVPYELPYLRIIGFLALTLLTVQGANLVFRRSAQHLPLITTNCAVLGVALLTAGTSGSLMGAIALGFGAGLGFSLVLLLFSGLRPRLEQAPVPAALRGPAIALITLGMMSLAVLGFSGFGS
jgi:Na+-translocating ferredoxin:NAD+ oxidoreductase subunit A